MVGLGKGLAFSQSVEHKIIEVEAIEHLASPSDRCAGRRNKARRECADIIRQKRGTLTNVLHRFNCNLKRRKIARINVIERDRAIYSRARGILACVQIRQLGHRGCKIILFHDIGRIIRTGDTDDRCHFVIGRGGAVWRGGCDRIGQRHINEFTSVQRVKHGGVAVKGDNPVQGVAKVKRRLGIRRNKSCGDIARGGHAGCPGDRAGVVGVQFGDRGYPDFIIAIVTSAQQVDGNGRFRCQCNLIQNAVLVDDQRVTFGKLIRLIGHNNRRIIGAGDRDRDFLNGRDRIFIAVPIRAVKRPAIIHGDIINHRQRLTGP